MTRGGLTFLLLLLSNSFMTVAWYGHLKYSSGHKLLNQSLVWIILASWGIALFEYMFQVPANRIGYRDNGGPFSLMELKVIQEVVNLSVFVVFTTLLFRNESFRWNHGVAFLLLVLAVLFAFKR